MKKSKSLVITKRIFLSIGIALSAILVFIAIWLCVDRFIYKSKVPSFMGYASLTVATGSMSGTIEKGDFIIIKDTGDYKIGDIITFIHPGESIPTTHRIIQRNDDGSFITKGDANNSQDIRVVTENEIFGEVVSVCHGLGILIGWVTTGGGYIYILSLILIVGLSIYLLKSRKSEVKPNTEKQDINNEKEIATPLDESETNKEDKSDKLDIE